MRYICIQVRCVVMEDDPCPDAAPVPAECLRHTRPRRFDVVACHKASLPVVLVIPEDSCRIQRRDQVRLASAEPCGRPALRGATRRYPWEYPVPIQHVRAI